MLVNDDFGASIRKMCFNDCLLISVVVQFQFIV
jgi:hypothetical protein